MLVRVLAAAIVPALAQCAIARGVRPPQRGVRMYPDPRLILVDTRPELETSGSASPPPPVHVVKSAPGPKQEERAQAEPPRESPKPEPPKKEDAKPEPPKKDDPKPEPPKKDDPPKTPPKAAPQPGPTIQPPPANKQPPKRDEHADNEDQDDDIADDAHDEGAHEGGPPSGDAGNRRATPQGRRQFTPVRGGEHKRIKPKGVGFQFLRDMFSSDADAARLCVPLALALLSAILL